MKNLLLAVVIFLTTFSTHAQYSTKGFSFQGYASDPEGKALGSVGITVKFTLYSGTNTNLTYVEEQTLTTDAYGVFSATIGKGTVVGADTKTPYAALNLNLYKYSLKVEVKKTAGGSYTTISDAELNAVPYARSAENGVPVGTIVAFAGPTTNIPAGWALCDGSSVDGTLDEWKALFGTIGISWGGSGTTFNLPDCRGMFLRGVDGGRGADNSAGLRTASQTGGNTGDNVGTYEGHSTALPGTQFTGATTSTGTHEHNYISPTVGTFQGLTYDGGGGAVEYPDWGTTAGGGNHNHTIAVNGGGDAETRPENVSVYYIIKK